MSAGAGRRAGLSSRTYQSEWVLIDADGHRLLFVGSRIYDATSARATLDNVGRRALLPALRQAMRKRQIIDTTYQLHRDTWHVRAVPLLGVKSRAPIAALGFYQRPGRLMPPPPAVGTWEWRVTPPGPGQQLETHVSPATYEAYGVEPREHTVDSSTWQDAYLTLPDRPRARAFFMRILHDPNAATGWIDFTAGPPGGVRYALRCVGRRYDHDGESWLRGVTFRRSEDPVVEEPRLLDALLLQSPDPLWLVDQYKVIHFTTDDLKTYDLLVRPTRSLEDLCHPDDWEALQSRLRWAEEHLGAKAEPVGVRFASARGGWRLLEVHCVGFRSSDETINVSCRVRTP